MRCDDSACSVDRSEEMSRGEGRRKRDTYGLLNLDRVNVYLGTRVLKRVVEHEYIVVVHIFSSWAFLEHPFLPAR